MKKFSAFICTMLIMLTICLTGCAGFEVNRVKYYNDVVAKVGDTRIRRYELLSAYSSYGQSYYGSDDTTEALNSTLDMLIDRIILLQYAKSHKDSYGLTRYQVNQAVQSVFDSLDSQMETYVKNAKVQLEIEVKDSATEESENSETAYKHENYVYKQRAKVVDVVTYYVDEEKTEISTTPTAYSTVEYKIEYIVESEPASFDALVQDKYLNNYEEAGFAEEVKAKYLEHFRASLADEEQADRIYNKALNLLAQDLINYEKYLRDDNGKAYNKNTQDLILRFVERNLDGQIESQYLTNVRTEYLKNEKLDLSLLTEKYKDMVSYNYAKYRNHDETYKKDMKDIGTKGDTILYHKDLTDGTKFGYFAHTLFQFSDAQKSEITALEKRKNDLTDEQYKTEYNTIVAKTQVNPRNLETGLVNKDEVVTLAALMAEYEDITKIADKKEKLEAFIQFMFKYTGDTATLSAGMPYVVGTNGNSGMEAAFTKEAERLMTEGAVGDMTVAGTENMCVTSYGIHVLYYIADVRDNDIPYADTDAVYIQNINRADNASANLYFKEINPLTHETYFDMLFDEVYPASSSDNYSSNTGYSDFEKKITDGAKDKVVKYTTKIKATKIN